MGEKHLDSAPPAYTCTYLTWVLAEIPCDGPLYIILLTIDKMRKSGHEHEEATDGDVISMLAQNERRRSFNAVST